MARFQVQAGLLHFVVGQALAAADHALREARLHHLQVRAEGHPGAQRQPVDALAQAAQLAAQALRQHRDALVGEVHRGAPQLRLGVQRAALLHVMADVGDVDAQDPAAALVLRQDLQADGVVEILRGGRVNGAGQGAAQILAPLHPVLGDLRGQRRQLVHHRGGKRRPQVEQRRRQLVLDLQVGGPPQLGHHHAMQLLGVGIGVQLDAHQVAVPGQLGGRHGHDLREPRLQGDRPPAPLLLLQVRRDGLLAPAQDPHHPRVEAPVPALAGHLRLHPVAVDRAMGIPPVHPQVRPVPLLQPRRTQEAARPFRVPQEGRLEGLEGAVGHLRRAGGRLGGLAFRDERFAGHGLRLPGGSGASRLPAPTGPGKRDERRAAAEARSDDRQGMASAAATDQGQ